MGKKSVQFINLPDKHAFILTANNTIQTNTKRKPKKMTVGSRLYYHDIITHSFKLEKKYTPQELSLTIEFKMYEDLGLDTQKIYQISYIQKHTEIEDILLIEAFAFDIEAIKEKYASTLKTVKHLDYLCIPSLTYTTLYTNNMIPISNDVFIYIAEDEAFLTFYKDGGYISSKKIKSLQDMVKELNSKNIYITPQELKEVLYTKGIGKEQYALTEYTLYDYLHTTFAQLFSTINNLALHSRSIYNFEQLHKVYFSLEGKLIPALQKIMDEFLENTTLHPLDMLSKKENINFLDLLSAYYIQDKIEQNDHVQNITFYKQKVPFQTTEVGRFSLITAVGITLLALYPIYQQYQIHTLTQENSILQEKADSLSTSVKTLQKKHASIKTKIAEYSQQEKQINENLDKLHNIANTLLSLKAKDTKYTTILLTINDLLQKYKLILHKVEQSGEHKVDLEIYSKENRRNTIALFMQDLLAQGYKNVYSNEIKLNEDTYKSIITVQR